MPAATLQLAILILALGNASQVSSEEDTIRRLLERQQQDWNRGDIEAFMSGYERDERLVFTSGGQIRRGWQATLERYRKAYPDRQSMGTLSFSDLEVRIIGKAAAVVLGRWDLRRLKDHPHGVFTLVLERGDGGWRIVHDHTSSTS